MVNSSERSFIYLGDFFFIYCFNLMAVLDLVKLLNSGRPYASRDPSISFRFSNLVEYMSKIS